MKVRHRQLRQNKFVVLVQINSVGVLGLLGNVVSIIVLSRPQMKSSINTLLIGLVGCDSLLIITSIFMFCFTVFRYTGSQFFQDYYWRIYPYVVPFVYPVALMAQTGSAYLTLAVTIERYLVGHLRLTFAVSFTWVALFKTSKPHF